MRPRDSQRSKVYAAENSVFQFGQTIANSDLQRRAEEILDRRPIRARWGQRTVYVELGRSRGYAQGSRITLGVDCRNDWVLTHEIAHTLTPRQYAAHGPEYVGVFLFVVETVMGKDKATELRAAFKARRVRSNRKAIPAVRVDVPEAKADRERADRARARAAAESAIRSMIRRGEITKAAARRVIDAA